MKARVGFVLAIALINASWAYGQAVKRWAVLPAHGPSATANAAIAFVESFTTDALSAKLIGLPGVQLIDRASLDKVLKEQNIQNNDRSSAEAAVRIGKLLGAGQIVLLQVSDASYTTHPETEGNTTRVIGTVVLAASARLVDVETGVIQAQPTSNFQDQTTVSETTKSNGFNFGNIHTPPKQKTTGGDPNVIQKNEWGKAVDAVVAELAAKLAAAAPAAALQKVDSAMVAGIANGSVYINRGSGAGIKAGDKFEVTRQVSLGLTDPETGKPMVQSQRICVLTVERADESNSSGKCDGGLPQPKDVATPMKH